MDVATIVIEQPYGTVRVTVDVPVGDLEGQLDSNVGQNLIHAEGFGIDGEGTPYFQTGGAADGERAALGLSGDGQVSLTRAGIPGGAMSAIEPGTRSPIRKPPRPLTRLARRLARKRTDP